MISQLENRLITMDITERRFKNRLNEKQYRNSKRRFKKDSFHVN